MLKKVLPVLVLILIVYPPFKSWFYSQKFKKLLEESVQNNLEELAVSTQKFESSVRSELLQHIPSYHVIMEEDSLTFYWAEDTLIVNVNYSIPVNYYLYRLYPQYNHHFQVDLREIIKAKRIKENIERRYRSLP